MGDANCIVVVQRKIPFQYFHQHTTHNLNLDIFLILFPRTFPSPSFSRSKYFCNQFLINSVVNNNKFSFSFVYLAIIIRHCCYTTEQNSWMRPYNEINTLTFMYINCTVHALTLRCVFKKKLTSNVRRQFFFSFILVLQSSHVIYYVWIECGPGESLYWRWRQGSRSHCFRDKNSFAVWFTLF